MVQTRSLSSNNIGANPDVAEASMNQKKRRTTSENSILKPIEESKKTTKKLNAGDARTSKKSKSSEKLESLGGMTAGKRTDHSRARDMFMKEYKAKYLKKHPEVTRWSFEKECVGQSEFCERAKKEKSKFVNEYLQKYKDLQAEYGRLEKDFLMGKLKKEDKTKYPGWPCEMSPTYCRMD